MTTTDKDDDVADWITGSHITVTSGIEKKVMRANRKMNIHLHENEVSLTLL